MTTLSAARWDFADTVVFWLDEPSDERRGWMLEAAEVYRRRRDGD